MGTVRFELRKQKVDKYGYAPVLLVYQLHSQKKYLGTGQKVYIYNWNEEDQEAIYLDKKKLQGVYEKAVELYTAKLKRNAELKAPLEPDATQLMMDSEVKRVNNELGDLKRKIENIEEKFKYNEKVYNIEMVFEELQEKKKPITKKDKSSEEVFAFIKRFIVDHEHDKVKGSLSVYKSLGEHLKNFEDYSGYKVRFDKIDYQFFQSFKNYLISLKVKLKDGTIQPRLNNITIAKQLSTLKTFLNAAPKYKIDVPNNYSSYKVKRETELEVISLTRDEFERLYDLELTGTAKEVRDSFIFSCVTGLRYSDIRQLRWEHINDDGIDITAIKTSHKTQIPHNDYTRAILKRYKGTDTPLKVISNQKSNEWLEKICLKAKINSDEPIVRKYGNKRIEKVYKKFELVRFHCGRKTFATLSLEAGMTAQEVMKIGGWKDYRSFQRYMNISETTTKAAMSKAWGRVVSPKMKAV
jgi:integrase